MFILQEGKAVGLKIAAFPVYIEAEGRMPGESIVKVFLCIYFGTGSIAVFMECEGDCECETVWIIVFPEEFAVLKSELRYVVCNALNSLSRAKPLLGMS